VMDVCGNSDTEITRVSRIAGSGILEKGIIEDICARDFPAPDGYDLTHLYQGDFSGGIWSLYSSPNNVDITPEQNGSVVTTDLIPGEYLFRYIIGCEKVIEVGINVLNPDQEPCVLAVCDYDEISTALTPNDDGVNDVFDSGLIPGNGCTVDVQIFNRWGNKIFEAQNYQNDWEGTVDSHAIGSARKITAGTYYYILFYKSNGKVDQTLRGYFYVATK